MLLSRDHLAVLPAASKDATRYQLCGVHVTARGDRTQATATDGKILARVTAPTMPEEEFPAAGGELAPVGDRGVILRSENASAIAKDLRTGARGPHPFTSYARVGMAPIPGNTLGATVVTFPAGPGSAIVRAGADVDASYPDCDRIFGDAVSASFLVDPEILLRAAKILADVAKASGRDAPKVLVELPEPGSSGQVDRPIRCSFEGSPGHLAEVLIMPLVRNK